MDLLVDVIRRQLVAFFRLVMTVAIVIAAVPARLWIVWRAANFAGASQCCPRRELATWGC